MKSDVNKIIDGLMKRGYDVFINNNTITILYDGFVKTIPLDNTLNLLYDKLMPMTINQVISHLISMHTMSKDIKEGKYDNVEPMTGEQFHNKLYKIVNNHFRYKFYDENVVDWYSTNLLDSVREEGKELLIRWFNLIQKEIKNIPCENERFKALIYPIIATIYKEIHIDWHDDIKIIINEVKKECVDISDNIDSEMKFVREFSKNKVEEIKKRMADSMR